MSRNVTCACIAVAAYLASAGAEAALRCGNLLAQEGDSSAAVLQKCGEPSFTQSYCEEPPTKKEDAPIVVPCEAVEEWTYNPAAGQLTPTLKFKRGKLVLCQVYFDGIYKPNFTRGKGYPEGLVMAKKYIVRLSEEERRELEALVKKGRSAARKRLHAEILLKADEGEHGPAWKDADIIKAFDVDIRTVERVRQRLVEEGFETALNGRKQSRHKSPKLDGEQEAHLIALACSEPPAGYARWTLRLLAGRMVELEYTEGVSHETVRQVLKKTNLNRG
jgi:transposase